jgi:hypothetical protein
MGLKLFLKILLFSGNKYRKLDKIVVLQYILVGKVLRKNVANVEISFNRVTLTAMTGKLLTKRIAELANQA